jgi:hypothetical protein
MPSEPSFALNLKKIFLMKAERIRVLCEMVFGLLLINKDDH